MLAPTLKPVFVTPCTALKTSAAFVALVFVDVKVPALPTLVMVWLPALIPAFVTFTVFVGSALVIVKPVLSSFEAPVVTLVTFKFGLSLT